MMTETTIIRIGMTAQDITMIDLASLIAAFLHSLRKDVTTTVHLVDSSKVKDKIMVKTRVITILEVLIEALTINVVIDVKAEVSMIVIIKGTITTSKITRQIMGTSKTLN